MPSTNESPSQLPSKINNRYVIAIGIASMMITISSTLVLLRFLSRYITKSIKWDDWCCLMSLIFAYGNLITTVLSATIGRSGYHIALYSAGRLRKIYKVIGFAFILPLTSKLTLPNATCEQTKLILMLIQPLL